MTSTLLVFGLCAGLAATATMDVLAGVLRRLDLSAGAEGRWVGRWYLGIPHGQFVHTNIAISPSRTGEESAAVIGHYGIGITLAVLYFSGTNWLELSSSDLLLALGYGLATSVFPWFLVFPALGFGVLGLKGPRELKLFSSSLLNHLSYGLGLWWTAKVLSWLHIS